MHIDYGRIISQIQNENSINHKLSQTIHILISKDNKK